jgi:ankyrin repeat protein
MEKTFRALLASRPNLVETLTDDDHRRLPDAAQNNNTNAGRMMLEAGWPVDVPVQHGLTPLHWAAWHGNADMVREVLRFHPKLGLNDNEFGVTKLGSALHGSENGWHRNTGDYGATVELLLKAGAKAPEVTDDLEASEASREALRLHAAGAGS